MRKLFAIGILCLFALLLIAARPRPCRTRDECFYRFVLMHTLTPTPTASATLMATFPGDKFPGIPVLPIFLLPTSPETLCQPCWTNGDGVEHCGPLPDPVPTFIPPPPGYPPPV